MGAGGRHPHRVRDQTACGAFNLWATRRVDSVSALGASRAGESIVLKASSGPAADAAVEHATAHDP